MSCLECDVNKVNVKMIAFFKEHFYVSILFSQTKTEISLSSLSIAFENVDTAKKKAPVHALDGLTLSYKVRTAILPEMLFSVKTRTHESWATFYSEFLLLFS